MVAAISSANSKVVDVETILRCCKACQESNLRTGRKITIEIVRPITADQHQVWKLNELSEFSVAQYRNMVHGDGDSKSYEKVQNIYNGKHGIKYESIGYYQKRAGIGLENCEQKQKVSVERKAKSENSTN